MTAEESTEMKVHSGEIHPQKRRRGLRRLWHATGYSLAGLRTAWGEAAFRTELLLAAVLVPGAFWLGQDWVQIALLLACPMLLLVVELLNTAIEKVVDRIGTERHPLSGSAKDTGSAAVFLTLALCVAVWGLALWARFVDLRP